MAGSEFFQHFSQVEAKNLAPTREVLKEQEQLETLIPKLQGEIRIKLAKMDEIEQESAVLKQRETENKINESVEATIDKNEDKLVSLCVEVQRLIEQIHKSIDRLRQINLKPNPPTEVDRLNLLIESEQQEAKTGWQDRVKQLKEFREDAELYWKVIQFGSPIAVDAVYVQYCDQRSKLMERIKQYRKFRSGGHSSICSIIFGGDNY